MGAHAKLARLFSSVIQDGDHELHMEVEIHAKLRACCFVVPILNWS